MKAPIAVATVLYAVLASAVHTSQLQTNEQAAQRDARSLVARLRLPPGTQSGRTGTQPVSGPTPSSVGDAAHARWTSGEAPQTIIKYIRSHPPTGSSLESWGSGGNAHTGATDLTLMYTWPATQELYNRSLSISVAPLPGSRSAIIATSQSDWMVPRPASEQVPSGTVVADVTLRLGHGSLGNSHVITTTHAFTKPATIRALVANIDALPTVQPGLVYGCPLILAGPERPLLTLTFRAGDGPSSRALARAQVGVFPGKHGASGWTSCDPIDFWVDGKSQEPLTSQTFVTRIAKLIGVDIS
jgi:hypothetical protein